MQKSMTSDRFLAAIQAAGIDLSGVSSLHLGYEDPVDGTGRYIRVYGSMSMAPCLFVYVCCSTSSTTEL